MRRATLTLATLVLLLTAANAGPVLAGIIFNDYGPAYTYNIEVGDTVSGATSVRGSVAEAFEFTPASTEAVTSVDFGIGYASGTNSVTVDLMTDNGGVPGSVLESYSFAGLGPFGSQDPPLTALSLSNPILAAGTNYWVVGFPGASDTYAAWNWNDQAVTGPGEFSTDGGSTWSVPTPNVSMGAFEIFGTAVPEPASLVLFGIGIAGLAVFGRRRRKLAAW